MLREYAVLLITTSLFPVGQEKPPSMNKKEFKLKVKEADYLFLKPNEIRKGYSLYVIQNRSRALLPSRTILRAES